jgi:SAM-dependent methyltransferase
MTFRPALRLAGYSALILFFELAFIRYTSAYVRVFGFYVNFVVIATFLGMGVGLLRAERSPSLKWIAVPATLLMIGAIAFFSTAKISVPNDPNEFVWGIFDNTGKREIPLIRVVSALFALCALFFLPLGTVLGAQFKKLPPLQAYAADIAGSLVGIAAFGALSALRQPPVVWLLVGIGLWVVVSIEDWRFAASLGVTGLAVALIVGRTAGGDGPEYWSPYYRISLRPVPHGTQVDVNGSLHQIMLRLDSATAARDPYIRPVLPAYTRPYHYAKRLDTVLVVGAGTGNDLALLLRAGAQHIVAVEIDPTIAQLGMAGHPLQPYADPRVHLVVDDARAFLRRTHQKFDVVVFGTLDSQTLLSGMSSVRLDNYVYTVESFQAARSVLKPEGTLIVYHRSGNPAITGKLYQMIGAAFQSPPGVFAGDANLFNFTFIAGYGANAVPAVTEPVIQRALTAATPGPHDDWPYLYLTNRTIPAHYIVALVAVLAISVLFLGVGAGDALVRGIDLPMFLMGVGFLLVETKSITEMSLLFGSTWTVNLLVFGSILIMVLLANAYVQKRRPGQVTPLFVALLVTLAVAYVIPASALLQLGPAAQWIGGALMVSLPVLFASLIFSSLLARRADAARALAYNVFGAIVGGVLEYSSMALGIKALYLIAATMYVAVALLVRREDASLA